MRQRFARQTTLGITPISEVKFPLRSRDELPPVLKAMQHIFITPQLNEKVFALLETKVVGSKKKTGRKGMDLWSRTCGSAGSSKPYPCHQLGPAGRSGQLS